MKLKTILCELALAAAATSCMKGSYQTNFTAYCSFESDDMTVYTKDSIKFDMDFTQGNSIFVCGKRNEDKSKFLGGMMLTKLKDSKIEEGHIDGNTKSIYSVAADTAGFMSKGCAIFHDSQSSTTMPEHEMIFAYSKAGTCSLKRMMVANTNYVVNTAKYGNKDLGVRAFNSVEDKLVLKVTSYVNGLESGTTSITLLSYDEKTGLKENKGWRKLDVSKISRFDWLDFKLESTVENFPLYCCIDEMVVNVSIEQ